MARLTLTGPRSIYPAFSSEPRRDSTRIRDLESSVILSPRCFWAGDPAAAGLQLSFALSIQRQTAAMLRCHENSRGTDRRAESPRRPSAWAGASPGPTNAIQAIFMQGGGPEVHDVSAQHDSTHAQCLAPNPCPPRRGVLRPPPTDGVPSKFLDPEGSLVHSRGTRFCLFCGVSFSCEGPQARGRSLASINL